MIDLDAARKTVQEAEERAKSEPAPRDRPDLLRNDFDLALNDVEDLCKLVRDMADEIERLRPVFDAALVRRRVVFDEPSTSLESAHATSLLNEACIRANNGA